MFSVFDELKRGEKLIDFSFKVYYNVIMKNNEMKKYYKIYVKGKDKNYINRKS